MIAVSLNVGDGDVRFIKPAKLYMCMQTRYKHAHTHTQITYFPIGFGGLFTITSCIYKTTTEDQSSHKYNIIFVVFGFYYSRTSHGCLEIVVESLVRDLVAADLG